MILDEIREQFKEGMYYYAFSTGKIQKVTGHIRFSLYNCCIYCASGMLWNIETNETVKLVEN